MDMDISISLSITGTITIPDDSNSGGGSAPLVALAEADFKGASGSIGDVAKTFAECWQQNDAWGPYDPAHIVAGVGLRATASAGATDDAPPSATAELFAAINSPTGILAVIDYSLAQTGDGIAQIGVTTMDTPDYSEGWEYWDNSAGPTQGLRVVEDYTNENSPDPSATEPTAMGSHRAAVQLSASGLSFSVDGAAPKTWVSTTANSARNTFILDVTAAGNTGTAEAIVEKITFYAPQDVAALQTLSVA